MRRPTFSSDYYLTVFYTECHLNLATVKNGEITTRPSAQQHVKGQDIIANRKKSIQNNTNPNEMELSLIKIKKPIVMLPASLPEQPEK